MLDIFIGILLEGLIFGILALGVYISYKVLNFADLSVDGTFPLGAAVSAALILKGVNPWLCLVVSFVAGALAGTLTGVLHVKLKIKDLLCGILVMTLMYSVNYRIVGKPTEHLINENTIFSSFQSFMPDAIPLSYLKLILVFIILITAKLILDWYLRTKSGFLLRSVGDNESLVITLAQDPGKMKIIGLALANGLVALSGAVNLQSTLSFNVSGGTGKVVMGLAAVIIGTTVFRKVSFLRVTTSVIVGMIIYKACISMALSLGFEAYDLNMIITVLFVATLMINNLFVKRGDEIA